jgi:histidyl-tRNA synthetase
MSNKHLSTDSYKGVRDFYPEDAAIQQYIFSTWAKTAESFGFERYDASILEPSDLYKAKGAENEEMVNEQTYTFIDRGDREVTLRPEMTPTVARMVAGRARALSFPLRWYSIPNLFRYERMQKGRLREHWQLNCDMFGTTDYTADVEVIALAYQTLIDFGAKPEMFEIRINSREWLNSIFEKEGFSEEQKKSMLLLLDRKEKITNFDEEAEKIAGEKYSLPVEIEPETTLWKVSDGLNKLGIKNVKFSPSTVRGFSYYTGTIFEIFDVSGENNRSLLGGGRYDNLTGMFGGEPIAGIGFGMGDVTMRDFLETHNLLPANLGKTATAVVTIPADNEFNLDAQKVAKEIRDAGVSVTTDIGTKKLGKKISDAADKGAQYVIVVGEDEVSSQSFTLKNLSTGKETSGPLNKIIESL